MVSVAVSLMMACGSESSGDQDTSLGPEHTSAGHPNDGYVHAYAAALLEEPGSTYSPTQARCLATALVDVVGGPSVFEEFGVTIADIESGTGAAPEFEITDGAAAEFNRAVLQCDISLGALLADEVTMAGLDVDADFIDCIDDEASGTLAEVTFTSSDPTGGDALTAIALGCVRPSGS